DAFIRGFMLQDVSPEWWCRARRDISMKRFGRGGGARVTGVGLQIKEEDWGAIKARLEASCTKRGGKLWKEREKQTRAVFNCMDTNQDGFITQADVNAYATALRLPQAMVADFVQESSESEDGDDNVLDYEEFAASVRAREAHIYAVYDQINTNGKYAVTRKELEAGLRRVQLASGRYGKRKRISNAGVSRLMKCLDRRRAIDREYFRDIFMMLPSKELHTVTPYYMKVGMDLGTWSPPDKRKDGRPWGHLVAGGIAGIVSKSVSSPLNVVSIRMAIGKGITGGNVLQRMATVTNQVYTRYGLSGFWRGNLSNSLSSAPGKAVDFFSYAYYKKLLTGNESEPTDMQRFLAGAMAGVTSDTILYPLEVVSTRVALGRYKSMSDCVITILSKQGVKGFYAGIGSALAGVVPYAGVSFGAYDTLSSAYRRWQGVESAGVLPTLACGLTSGWCATLDHACSPLSPAASLQAGAPPWTMPAVLLECGAFPFDPPRELCLCTAPPGYPGLPAAIVRLALSSLALGGAARWQGPARRSSPHAARQT
ncbi:hypothetical protein CYMTET_35361, partial [Cymbomonas tetramitiformis]